MAQILHVKVVRDVRRLHQHMRVTVLLQLGEEFVGVRCRWHRSLRGASLTVVAVGVDFTQFQREAVNALLTDAALGVFVYSHHHSLVIVLHRLKHVLFH